MSRLHDHLTGKVKWDEEKKKCDADIEKQKKFESMMNANVCMNKQQVAKQVAMMGGVFDLLLKAQDERRKQK